MRPWLVGLLIWSCAYPPLSPPSSEDGAAPACFGSLFKVCFASSDALPTQPLIVASDLEIDTDSSPMCDVHSDRSDVCVVAGVTWTLAENRTLRAYGTKPLVLLSATTAVLHGTIDVASRHTGTRAIGAGAAARALCPSGSLPQGHSGGAGGSFHGRGGDGESKDGVPGKAADPVPVPATLRGGCFGGDGANQSAPSGVGGIGGGAVVIIAQAITLDGLINASGGGARGGPGNTSAGGGGGGSGGMIVLDAAISLGATARMFANGGGGA